MDPMGHSLTSATPHGEELQGAKQNRVLNLTILTPAHQSHAIPVSCVESGRWRRVSHKFAASPHAQFAEGRAAKMRHVTSSLKACGSRSSDQGDVWNLIAEKSVRLAAASETSAMSSACTVTQVFWHRKIFVKS